ncbi:MAG TPA: SUMF1/EgtB/PvdO family nonheme iron enzyme [Planctomycetaceae bacterium]|nr:SUMF1/EgtB/PvdO family nonheme iron enzyme [Planctomycetaceae bacterium]
MTKEQSAQHKDNWSAAGMVGMFDAVHRQRDQARYRRGVVLWCLTIAICLGIPLWITWGKFQDARRQTLLEEFASRRPVAEQQTTTNPASEEALRQADELRTSAQSKSVAESIVDLRRALQLLADAQDIDRDVKRLRDLLNPVGKTLTETPWHIESDVIDQQQKALGQRHKAIVALLEVGNTQQAEKELATLLADVGQLQRGNVEAMKTDTARQTWLRQKSHIPARLTDAPALAAILRRGKEGEDGWNSGDWTTARLSYSGAVEDLERILHAELTAEEKATLLESDADSLARLESEKADLAQQIDSLKQQINDLGTQLATTNGERQAALAKADELTKDRDRLNKSATTADSELKELRPLKTQLVDATKSLQAAQQQVLQLEETKTTAEQSVARLENLLRAKGAEADSLRASAAAGGGNSVEAEVIGALAAIDAAIAGIGGNKDPAAAATLARGSLADALVEYDKAVLLKQQALNEKYLPASSKVKRIEVAITQAEATLRSGLNVLDEPLVTQYEAQQQVIVTAEASYQTLLKEVAPDHKDAVALKTRIDGLKSQQSKLALAHTRHAGKSTPSASELVGLCRGQIGELLAERRKAEFTRLRADGKLPTAANIESVPISPGKFNMGSTEFDDEKPVRDKSISKAFYAGKYEVTIGQILTWLNSPGVTLNDEWIDLSNSDCPIRKSGGKFELNTSTTFGKSVDQPMVYVSWHGAKAFCEWCSKVDLAFTYRLPTEAEWEYMARAGSTTAYPWGDLCNGTEANVDGNHPHGTNTKGPYKQVTVPVGSYKPNAWGLYDTAGNAWEWCNDWYEKDYYANSPANDPQGPSSGSSRVLRGGSWGLNVLNARSSNRNNLYTPDLRNVNIGFRVVAE